ncbi:metallophosphoesterase [Rhodopirellula sp. JC740]|uniref:Metallophosphoesterase n=1 Tax=Rhodopirellula halodulae TaxID=2894198 RepID=A0ABS8NIL2_9BACT|nr:MULTISPECIES: metallophosphoesterase [unclassified Rhodopirellula]MCC9643371.1 metallophosphoesterase [Rhodopirellula sp. JC740]MCC9658234.1 metallophosphoesterase [Rhodopirellula sp. JC737]
MKSNFRRIAWVTDPHFDHAKLDVWQAWNEKLLELDPDAVLITGDLSEGDDVAYQLRCLAESLDRPILFVLGNHDFYGKSIATTRRDLIALSRDVPQLTYLTDHQSVSLNRTTVLIGDDGWGDATVGDYAGSNVRLNDFQLIEDFRTSSPEHWQSMLIAEGKSAADRIAQKLRDLPATITQVLIATHVPPFREACWYEGKTTDDNWAPFFVCGQLGEVLQTAAAESPDRRHTVLCGHTHHDGIAKLRDNLVVHTGASVYGSLEIESVISIEETLIELSRPSLRFP